MKILILFVFLCSTFLTLKSFASAQVYPTRVFLKDKNKIASISVRNTTKKPQTYTLKAVFYRMTEDGKMSLIASPTPEERSLVGHLKFSPRKISLRPGQEQVVRVIARQTATLAAGDYRAHLRVLPEARIPDSKEGMNMKIIPRIAVSVPVFYHRGKYAANAALNKTKLLNKDGKFIFSTELKNYGKSFLVGSFKVFLKEGNSKFVQIGEVNGVSSYVKNLQAQYQLSNLKSAPGKGDILRIIFQASEHLGGEELAMSEIIF